MIVNENLLPIPIGSKVRAKVYSPDNGFHVEYTGVVIDSTTILTSDGTKIIDSTPSIPAIATVIELPENELNIEVIKVINNLRAQGWGNYPIISLLFRDGLNQYRGVLQDNTKTEEEFNRLMAYLLRD